EIPEDCVMETRPRPSVRRPGPVFRTRLSPSPFHTPVVEEETAGGLKLGQRVRHARFGEGTVLSFEGDGDRLRIEVRFRDAGTKWLMLSYAHLQPL
ncbi:MAG: DNA helicase II, partial [Nevskiales bacterium]|nr:DNA helicase II [Nevskiales bacterium]